MKISISSVTSLAGRNGGVKSIRHDGKRYESLSQVRVGSFPMPTCDKVYVNCENGKTIKLKVGSSGPFSGIEIHAAYLDGEKLEVDTLGNLHVPMIRPFVQRGVRARQFGRQGWSNLVWRS